MRRRQCIAVVCALIAANVVSSATADDPYGRHLFDEYAQQHWSFQPLKRPAVAAPKNTRWVRNPIDAYILAGLEAAGLEPSVPTDRATLLRRVSLDLIGLPPTPEEVDAFLADDSPTAYERVVDDLLSRPQYGERWARHWLDVVRYGETNGYERDGAKPQAWKYRQWVIDALNNDMPYDRFVIEQLAGDEIEDSDAASQIATTMLRLGPWDDEPADPLADRYDQLDDIIGTTSAAFMAMTLRCARCHDHKFEPLLAKDYARWMAIFAPLKRPQEGARTWPATSVRTRRWRPTTRWSRGSTARRRTWNERFARSSGKPCSRPWPAGGSPFRSLPPDSPPRSWPINSPTSCSRCARSCPATH